MRQFTIGQLELNASQRHGRRTTAFNCFFFFVCFFQYLLIDSGLRLCDQQPDELFVLTSSGSEETSYETSECFPLLSEKPFVNNTNLHWLVLIRPFIHQVNSLKKSSALISIPVGIDLLSVDVDGRLAVA